MTLPDSKEVRLYTEDEARQWLGDNRIRMSELRTVPQRGESFLFLLSDSIIYELAFDGKMVNIIRMTDVSLSPGSSPGLPVARGTGIMDSYVIAEGVDEPIHTWSFPQREEYVLSFRHMYVLDDVLFPPGDGQGETECTAKKWRTEWG